MTPELQQTPLSQVHRALGARMAPFANWEMPIDYTGILSEAAAVREHAGIFDISHMGRLFVRGAGAFDTLQRLTSNDVAALHPSMAQYSLLTNARGGMLDDIIVYRTAADEYLVVLNASNAEKDIAWLTGHASPETTFDDQTGQTGMIAVQGPDAVAMAANLAGEPALAHLSRFQCMHVTAFGARCWFCRTGYTGEDGFEIVMPAAIAPDVWRQLGEAGAAPCGLGARDALRIEAGYPLYGHEIGEDVDPVSAGLMWVVKLSKGPFTGRESIEAVKRTGPPHRLMGLIVDGRSAPRQGAEVFLQGAHIGEVTSGVFSPTRGQAIAMAWIATANAKAGATVQVQVRDRLFGATVTPKKDLLADRKP
ncbi:MAG: glycine cleavage system aminomethyltransferase GcvT [Armatimonadetes bacterium]|nr:glycine cleavage system aminomethyltransferase GcvT [Armatimonadota bacterium]MDE2205439.1 glycine cleavage system aminomethyltransferase GcvT [Armatimonadota bacterium]